MLHGGEEVIHLHDPVFNSLTYNILAANMAWPPTEKILIIHDLVSAVKPHHQPGHPLHPLPDHSRDQLLRHVWRIIISKNPDHCVFWYTWPGAHVQGWLSWRISLPSCLLSSNRLGRRLGSGSFSCGQFRTFWSNCKGVRLRMHQVDSTFSWHWVTVDYLKLL